jgi:lipopolysaccharide/colanic/teichoic acid biosynthesis glycosyltransferase
MKNLIVLRDIVSGQHNGNDGLLQMMVCNEPFAGFVTDWLGNAASFCENSPTLAIPKQWGIYNAKKNLDIIEFTDNLPVPIGQASPVKDDSWTVISDGRFIAPADNNQIRQVLAGTKADLLIVNVAPELAVLHEKVLTSSTDELVGFRLFYEESLQPAQIPRDWPHHLFVKYASLNKIIEDDAVPLEFGKLLELCTAKSLVIQSIRIGGSILDLAQNAGLLTLVGQKLSVDYLPVCHNGNNFEIGVSVAGSARIFSRVLLGKNVEIGENAIIVGPTIIGNNVKIGADAVIRMSVIGPDVLVQAGDLIEQKVLLVSANKQKASLLKSDKTDINIQWDKSQNNFRNWEGYSYARHIKRIFDIIVSAIVLVLFAPFMPVIILAVKLTSPGPVFFKDIRQGLHGKIFKCIKFRTMQYGAHTMQDRLRALSQTDGPQFMIPDDPRITAVGKFLRETYIDEIPQFINVLLGQMSVVGPRPSPERENRLCPFWRDARLSVRPGITGLWQVCRTRGHMKDFQEWIHYDIKYVRELSPKLDLWICLQTAKRMAIKFINQF